MNVDQFEIHIEEAVLDDLRRRLQSTRFPDAVEPGWGYGIDLEVLKEFVRDWAAFDWRATEAELNQLPNYLAYVNSTRMHFVYLRADDGVDRPALVLLHGWPSSFLQMRPILPHLSDRFDLVVPSLPGFGFSDRPTAPGMDVARIAEHVHELMTEVLGYRRYGVRSSDLGAGVATALCLAHPDAIVASHESGTNPFLGQIPDDLSPDEEVFVQRAQAWMQSEMGYAMVQSSKPATLAAGLHDSPAGLAAWVLEKFERWSDGGLAAFNRDDLLANLTIYWATETIGSSIRLYAETARSNGPWGASNVPRGFAMLPADMFPTPRSWIERQSRVDWWTELSRGGHFGEWEVPELLAQDIKGFFDKVTK